MVYVSICLDMTSELVPSNSFVNVKLLKTFLFLLSFSDSFDLKAFAVPGGIGMVVSVALQVNL